MRFTHSRSVLALLGIGIAAVAALAAGCGVDTPAPPAGSDQLGAVQYADESNFGDLVLRAQGPVLVDFYADWCGPCKVQAPILDDFARQAPQVSVVKVDVDQAPNLAMQYDIKGIPALRVFRDGQIVAEHTGVARIHELKTLTGI